ncbi:DegT/DnrJ/EryC1/StrS family aminotransferase [Magnetococcus sp. PR-3]|uniref:DegT/DnrJ/EryC1/StrS family aminotransferase n=1 Tax=Magnetococcus sp. PR-3 TaxID=3120355 RepID=UPI002FCE5280
MTLNWPLMDNNIIQQDLDALITFLQSNPRLTQSQQVAAFEQEWSQWLGVKHSVFVNSGASANMLTMAAIKHLHGGGEVIVPTLTWVSDISSVLMHGFTPVFVDINPRNLCMDEDQVLAQLNDQTRAVFITYVQGFNGLSDRLLKVLKARNIPLIEDVCESHGATFKGQKLGSFGLASNFSYYFAHHMSTIEGGMVCTNDDEVYDTIRALRSHGMVREMRNAQTRDEWASKHPDLSPDFIFAMPAYNARNTEIGGVLGRSQLKRLDTNNAKRTENFTRFLDQLDSQRYRTDFDLEGSCNYAFNLILKDADDALRNRLEKAMSQANIEFRRGSAGGGNQLRQPYLREHIPAEAWLAYPHVEHVHFYAYYIGNYPSLEPDRIDDLCRFLNEI